jgi:hypothetical protein
MHTTNTVREPVNTAVHACESIDQVRELQEAIPADAPYAPDWMVQRIVDLGPREQFRWYVVGVNANYDVGHPDRRFYWSVPRLCWRYELSAAKLVTKDEALRHRIEGA